MDTNLIFAGKPVENRTWEPPAGALGTEFVVHAGKAWAPARLGLYWLPADWRMMD